MTAGIAGSRAPSLRVSAAVRCQLWLFSVKKAWPGLATRQSRLQTVSKQGRCSIRLGSQRQSSRALSSNSYEGWPRARRMGVTHHTAPVGRSGRSAPPDAHPLFAQHQPLHGRVAITMRRPRPVTLQNAVDLLALAAPLSRPPGRNAPVGHHAPLYHLLDLIEEAPLLLPGRGCSIKPLPGSYEPRAVLGVPYPVGHEVHINCPGVHTMLPNLAVHSLLGDLGHRTAELGRSITPNRFSTLRQYRSNSRPRRIRPQHLLQFNQHSQLLMAGTLPSRNSGTMPLTSSAAGTPCASCNASCLRVSTSVALSRVASV